MDVRIWIGKFSDYPEGVYTKKEGIFTKEKNGFRADAVFLSESGKELAVSGFFPLKKEGLFRGDVYSSIVFISKSTQYMPRGFFTREN
ncbi:hypothetical protein MLD52_23005 [Puniceicoccaceae bacterium K14]|nr:hypothetical protein [Puniceicoccaceae bacterium K14]